MKSIFVAGSANSNLRGAEVCPPLTTGIVQHGFIATPSPQADFFINVNHNDVAYNEFLNAGGSPERAYLILLEPESVYPHQYTASVLKKYAKKITPGSTRFNRSQHNFIGWPYILNANPSKPSNYRISLDKYLEFNFEHQIYQYSNWNKRAILLSMISANKVGPNSNNMYGLRRKLAHTMSPTTLQVYGPLWNVGLLKSIKYRLSIVYGAIKVGSLINLIDIFGNLFWHYACAHGEVPDKHGILKNSKFALIIENDPNYVSEKLFDALINGAIPIYFGPNLEKVGIPVNVAIYSKPESQFIEETLKSLSSDQINLTLKKITKFLNSDTFLKNWREEFVYFELIRYFFEEDEC
jgi:hypothetical protein